MKYRDTKELKIEARIENLDKVFDFVNAELEALNYPQNMRSPLFVAAEEIFVNIASYAYSPQTGFVLIRISGGEHEIGLEFEDTGKPYNPLKTADPDTTASMEDRLPGGLGIFMVKQSMDMMEYRYEDNKNILKLTKYRQPCAGKERGAAP
jgi:anti-sigma regulatory factor (Ser/Thr protein kinase)